MDAIAPELLEILVCPETHQSLKPAPDELLRSLAELQAQGKLKNRAGALVSEPLSQALVREDGAFAYPVRDGIPVMLIDEAIPLK